jgi:hypothetical protein
MSIAASIAAAAAARALAKDPDHVAKEKARAKAKANGVPVKIPARIKPKVGNPSLLSTQKRTFGVAFGGVAAASKIATATPRITLNRPAGSLAEHTTRLKSRVPLHRPPGSTAETLKSRSFGDASWLKALKQKKAQAGGATSAAAVASRAALGKVGKVLGAALKGAQEDASRFPDAIAAFKQAATREESEAQVAKTKVNELLEFTAMRGTPAQYLEALALVGQLKPEMDVRFYAKILLLLTSRMPVPVTALRLTLNLCVIPEGSIVPPVQKDNPQSLGEGEETFDVSWCVDPASSVPSARGSLQRSLSSNSSRVSPEMLRGRVRASDKKMTAYYGHFVTLLHLEFLEELKSMTQRLERPVADLVRMGFMLQGLRVVEVSSTKSGKTKKVSGLPGKKVSFKTRVVFRLPGPVDVTNLRIKSGDTVLLSRTGPLADFVGEGLVDYAPSEENQGTGSTVTVTFNIKLEETWMVTGSWRLDSAFNRTAYERQLLALVNLAFSSARPELSKLLLCTDIGGANVDAWANRVRTSLLQRGSSASVRQPAHDGAGDKATDEGGAAELKRLASEAPKFTWESKKSLDTVVAELRATNSKYTLNPSQRQAVAGCLGRRLTMIQGPPGTGKTHVSVNLLELWARRIGVRPLLATSDSNIAVDNIAEGCIRKGLKVVRFGRLEKVTAELEDSTLESIVKKRRAPDSEYGKDDYHLKMQILREAEIVCATTIGSGTDFLNEVDFGGIVIDEVAQATELSAIVPIILRGSERLVLVGDHCQLPPSVLSLEAGLRGLTLSIFGRFEGAGLEPFFLDTQFRMHPMIAAFSSKEFYGGRLLTGVPVEDRPPPAGFRWPKSDAGVAFINVAGAEYRDGESRANGEEAAHVLEVVAEILAAGELSVLDVGVVSPYSAQVRGLRQLLRSGLPPLLQGSGVDMTGGLGGRRGQRALEIASVDAFQGREKELIVFSAVRSNKHGNVGFLSDWRRLNVMITRARRGLIVIGNIATLRADETWAKWLDWADAESLIVGDRVTKSNGWEAMMWKLAPQLGGGGGGGPKAGCKWCLLGDCWDHAPKITQAAKQAPTPQPAQKAAVAGCKWCQLGQCWDHGILNQANGSSHGNQSAWCASGQSAQSAIGSASIWSSPRVRPPPPYAGAPAAPVGANPSKGGAPASSGVALATIRMGVPAARTSLLAARPSWGALRPSL